MQWTKVMRVRGWCAAAALLATQTNFSGIDANGRAWTFTGPVVRLQAR